MRLPSGPWLAAAVPALSTAEVRAGLAAEPGDPDRVRRARAVQARRFGERSRPWNGAMDTAALNREVPLGGLELNLLGRARAERRLTTRGANRARRLARTLADLEGTAAVELRHLAAALDLVGPLATFEAGSEEGDVGGGGEG